jgi:hypothetical protein
MISVEKTFNAWGGVDIEVTYGPTTICGSVNGIHSTKG